MLCTPLLIISLDKAIMKSWTIVLPLMLMNSATQHVDTSKLTLKSLLTITLLSGRMFYWKVILYCLCIFAVGTAISCTSLNTIRFFSVLSFYWFFASRLPMCWHTLWYVKSAWPVRTSKAAIKMYLLTVFSFCVYCKLHPNIFQNAFITISTIF